MKKILFVIATLIVGLLLQLLFTRYLSVFGVAPQLLLLLVLALGFNYGPLMGETAGFLWGLLADAIAVSLFGLHSLLLTVTGYIAGTLRRRVASERTPAQVVIALITTIAYGIGVALVGIAFEGESRVSIWQLILGASMNAALVVPMFIFADWWLDVWNIQREPL